MGLILSFIQLDM